MSGLLDTCTLIWLDTNPGQLSLAAQTFLTDPRNDILLSVVSIWELCIKVPTGKLSLPDPVNVVVARQLANGVQLLSVEPPHPYPLLTLPTPHRDPFDRLLVAQALVEGAVVLTPDPLIHQYPVPVLW